MIFLTVGTSKSSFNRLLNEVDRLINSKIIKDKVIAQIGFSDYKPKNYEFFAFTTSERIESLNKNADIIISHAGAGCIINALKNKKPLILVPRLKKFDEHNNDHQLEIAKEFEREKRAIVVYDIKNLGKAIREIRKFNPKDIKDKKPPIIKILGDYLKQLELRGK